MNKFVKLFEVEGADRYIAPSCITAIVDYDGGLTGVFCGEDEIVTDASAAALAELLAVNCGRTLVDLGKADSPMGSGRLYVSVEDVHLADCANGDVCAFVGKKYWVLDADLNAALEDMRAALGGCEIVECLAKKKCVDGGAERDCSDRDVENASFSDDINKTQKMPHSPKWSVERDAWRKKAEEDLTCLAGKDWGFCGRWDGLGEFFCNSDVYADWMGHDASQGNGLIVGLEDGCAVVDCEGQRTRIALGLLTDDSLAKVLGVAEREYWWRYFDDYFEGRLADEVLAQIYNMAHPKNRIVPNNEDYIIELINNEVGNAYMVCYRFSNGDYRSSDPWVSVDNAGNFVSMAGVVVAVDCAELVDWAIAHKSDVQGLLPDCVSEIIGRTGGTGLD